MGSRQYVPSLFLLFKDDNNNHNSYIALYPINIYELAALYIINISVNLTIKKAQVTINAYVNINTTKYIKGSKERCLLGQNATSAFSE